MEFGKYPTELRERRGYSQRSLGIKSGISNSTISRLEMGISTPDVSTLMPTDFRKQIDSLVAMVNL